MKRFIILISFSFINVVLFATAPTVPASNIVFNNVQGNRISFSFTNGNGTGRLIVCKKDVPITGIPVNGIVYAANSTFGSGATIATDEYVISNTANSTNNTVFNVEPYTRYYFAIFEFNGSGVSTEYLLTAGLKDTTTLFAPTINVSAFSMINISGSRATLNFADGNGSGRLAIIKEGPAVTANPVDLTVYTTDLTLGGTASQIGVGNFTVYSRAVQNNIKEIKNLQPNTQYTVKMFEYNGTSGPVYAISAAPDFTFTTTASPTVQTSNFVNTIQNEPIRFNNIRCTEGNGNGRILVARAGSPVTALPVNGTEYGQNNDFQIAPEISSGQKVVYDGSLNNLSQLNNLTPGTAYYFSFFEYSGNGANRTYLTASPASGSFTTVQVPSTAASGINFTNITGNSVRANWTNGDGVGRLVLVKAAGAVDFTPVDYTVYNPTACGQSEGYFMCSQQFGTGNYAVYRGANATINITNLTAGVTYHIAVFEYNGNVFPIYKTNVVATASILIPLSPTEPSTALTFPNIYGTGANASWTNGNGEGRLIIAREGSAVTAVPVDGTTYTANGNFSIAPEIATAQKVVFAQTTSSSSTTTVGFSPATTYFYRIYDYNDVAGQKYYLTSSYLEGNVTTLSAPTIPASNISFTNIECSKMRINWTSGDGQRRVVFIHKGTPVVNGPLNGTTYSPFTGSTYGNNTECIYAGTGSFVDVTKLDGNVAWHIAIYEYNGTSLPVYSTVAATASQQTLSLPTINATTAALNNIEAGRMNLSYMHGNGNGAIIIAKAGSYPIATPVNGVAYIDNNNFSLAPEIAPGEKIVSVVYNNSSSLNNTSVNVLGLTHSTQYYYRVYAFAGDHSNSSATVVPSSLNYLSASPAEINAISLSPPTTQPNNLQVSAITGNSMRIDFSPGNGSSRLLVVRKDNPVNGAPSDYIRYNGNFLYGNGDQVGVGNYAAYFNYLLPPTQNYFANITGLQSGTTYHYQIFEANGNISPAYNTTNAPTISATTIGAPQSQPTTFSATGITTNTATLNWINGTGLRRIVLIKKTSAVNSDPVDNTVYTPNTFFGSGDQIGSGNFVLFSDNGNQVSVTNLEQNTTYHIAIYEYNNFSGGQYYYQRTSPLVSSFTTLSSPLPLKWVSVNGVINNQKQAVFNWKVEEINVQNYFIEKSIGGNVFNIIGTVSSVGDGTHSYFFTETNSLQGTAYYRIKQIDFDGKTSYSSVIKLSSSQIHSLSVYPNPVKNMVTINAGDNLVGLKIMLTDISGKLLKEFTISQISLTVDMEKYPSGVYFLIFNNSEIRKIIKK